MDHTNPSDQTICALCREPITLETANTDEDGHAVHAQCYAQKIATKSLAKTNPRLRNQ